jgi:hypothetical protein
VLDCPVGDGLDVAFWLELARRCLGSPRRAPSCFWSPRDGRLLLATGEVPAQVFPLLAGAGAGAKLWKLTTEMAAAVEQARAGLGEASELLQAASGTFADVLDAVAPQPQEQP